MYREIIKDVLSEVGNYARVIENNAEETYVSFIVEFYDEIEADEMRVRLMQDIAEIAYDYDWTDEVKDAGDGTYYVSIYSYNY